MVKLWIGEVAIALLISGAFFAVVSGLSFGAFGANREPDSFSDIAMLAISVTAGVAAKLLIDQILSEKLEKELLSINSRKFAAYLIRSVTVATIVACFAVLPFYRTLQEINDWALTVAYCFQSGFCFQTVIQAKKPNINLSSRN